MTPSPLDERLQQVLSDAALSPRSGAMSEALSVMVQAGVHPDLIAEQYIPAVARDFGDDWCSDRLAFAQVTIGCARLQALLRDLDRHSTGHKAATVDAPSVLVLVSAEVFHTLGALVLAHRLRRTGVTVRVMLGARPQEAAAAVSQTLYDAVFLSASTGETLESLRKIVDAIRGEEGDTPPIVAGGTILDERDDVAALIGADFATSDVIEAFALCGLTKRRDVAELHRTGR